MLHVTFHVLFLGRKSDDVGFDVVDVGVVAVVFGSKYHLKPIEKTDISQYLHGYIYLYIYIYFF